MHCHAHCGCARGGSGDIGRNFESDQLGFEATGAICPIGDAGGHPYGSQQERLAAEIALDESANEKAEGRHDESIDAAASGLLSAFHEPPMVNESRRVHSHECDEGTEVETLSADFVSASSQPVRKELEQAGPNERKSPHRRNVVVGNAAPGLDGAEERPGQSTAASHAVQEPPRGEL